MRVTKTHFMNNLPKNANLPQSAGNIDILLQQGPTSSPEGATMMWGLPAPLLHIQIPPGKPLSLVRWAVRVKGGSHNTITTMYRF